MCYKKELQKKNREKLQKKFDQENIPQFIQDYFVNINSKSGAINYWVAIRDLLLWLISEKIIKKSSLAEIDPEDFYSIKAANITLYLESKEESGMSPTTLETRKNIFSSFWNYLVESVDCPVENNIIKSVSYKGISCNNLIKKLPTETQLKMMEERLARKNDKTICVRNIAVFKLLKGSGIRESELAGLDISDLFLNEEIPYIKVLGKGKFREIESRIVYLTGEAQKAVEEWLIYRNKLVDVIKSDAVFITKTGKRLSESEIRSMFNNYSDGEITPHMMRHWYATYIASECGIVLAQQQLGHTSQNTTINNYASGIYGMKDKLASI